MRRLVVESVLVTAWVAVIPLSYLAMEAGAALSYHSLLQLGCFSIIYFQCKPRSCDKELHPATEAVFMFGTRHIQADVLQLLYNNTRS